jgi:hypothetical protein
VQADIHDDVAFILGQIGLVGDDVEAVAELDASAGDAVRWDPPAREAMIASFEAEHGITLPADYKAVLLELGNGSEGLISVFPLGEVIWDGDAVTLADWLSDVELAAAFPRSGDTGEMPAVDDDVAGDDDDDDANWNPPGALPVADNHAGGIMLLVVSGAQYGRLWEQEGGATLVPAPTPLLRPVGFAEWLAAELAKRLGRADLLAQWR